ncbi:hypothetical protein CY35_15G078200 [Sphagnum magellanicum]|nr:hypothetical protein CY35_15G078200 [Sphagnum magellanicum]
MSNLKLGGVTCHAAHGPQPSLQSRTAMRGFSSLIGWLPWRSSSQLLILLWWQTLAFVVASIATMLYLLAWAGSRLLDKWLPAVPGMRCMQNTSHTWHALQLRCHQLLSWPFILLWGGNGPEQANVGMAHRCRQAKHATWTAAVVDMAMGAVAGVLVVRHQSWITHFVQRMVRMLTNDILRTGCIWLMGVPAGFKLNDELAARLGTLSLHVIQTWATVGVLVRPALRICLPVLGLLAMLLGITVPAAILVDTILLGTIHIAILHQATASLYANQLRALAALWRLFRGSKRNPLRGRQDTYDCSVEQLVAGSLMFTPLLLLLPTTSVFYTFFTLIYSVLSIIRLCLQYLILILQSFPYSQVVLWLFQPQMFPSGIWFQVVCMDHDVQMSSSFQSLPTKNGHRYHNTRRNCGLQETVASESSSYMNGVSEEGVLVTQAVCGKAQATTTLASRLGVERASLGELLAPFVEQLKGVCPLSSAVALMYKLVSGGRIPGALELEMGEKLPYTLLSIPMFWRLCYEAVIMTLHNQ